jgi:hypothetical protein
MKHLSVYVIPLIVVLLFTFSCKRVDLTSRYNYNQNKDTIPPVFTLTVPVNLDNFPYGKDIHMVGTATDLESKNNTSTKAGKLKNLYLNVSIMDPSTDTVIKVIYSKWLNVDGKNGVTINEKTLVNSGSGITYCRLTGFTTDYADRTDSVKVNFTVN